MNEKVYAQSMVMAVIAGSKEGVTVTVEVEEPTPPAPKLYPFLPWRADMGYDPDRERRLASIVAAPGIDAEKLRAALSKSNSGFRERRVIARIEELMAQLRSAQTELLAGDRRSKAPDKIMAPRVSSY